MSLGVFYSHKSATTHYASDQIKVKNKTNEPKYSTV